MEKDFHRNFDADSGGNSRNILCSARAAQSPMENTYDTQTQSNLTTCDVYSTRKIFVFTQLAHRSSQ